MRTFCAVSGGGRIRRRPGRSVVPGSLLRFPFPSRRILPHLRSSPDANGTRRVVVPQSPPGDSLVSAGFARQLRRTESLGQPRDGTRLRTAVRLPGPRVRKSSVTPDPHLLPASRSNADDDEQICDPRIGVRK
jgi:hypothetical protein